MHEPGRTNRSVWNSIHCGSNVASQLIVRVEFVSKIDYLYKLSDVDDRVREIPYPHPAIVPKPCKNKQQENRTRAASAAALRCRGVKFSVACPAPAP